MNFIKPNLKSLPEQVDINTNDIKNLKSVLKSSYKTEKELTTSTITILISDTNAPQGTTSGWLFDSVGHLYSINGGDDTNLLLEYYTNFRGPAGVNGVAVVQTTGTSTESVMSQNAVTTELESKANLDAGNLSSENVTSWSNKLGIGAITTELTGKANIDASNLSSENVTSWGNKLGIGAITTELTGKANIDASNLSSENVTSWGNKLGIGAITNELESKAKSDASNLSDENVSSWVNKLGCEKVVTIYDKNSTDPSINLGYTSGLTNGLSVTGSFDTENVKSYLVTVRMNSANFCLRYDPNTYSDGTYTNSFGQLGYVTFEDNNTGYFYTCCMYITSSKIEVNKLGFWRNSATLNTNSNFYVSKIEAIY